MNGVRFIFLCNLLMPLGGCATLGGLAVADVAVPAVAAAGGILGNLFAPRPPPVSQVVVTAAPGARVRVREINIRGVP